MCIEVWIRYREADCDHRQYQNTFLCHIARRSQPDDDLVMEHTVHLPEKLPKIPPGLLDCKRRIATKPIDGRCPECLKKARKANTAGTEGMPLSVSNASMVSNVSMVSSVLGNSAAPSAGEKAVEQVRNSLIKVAEKQRITPSSEWRELEDQKGDAEGT
ncbi:hypothetical protein F5B20DRAFT_584163 [Whalleya microplaca]|nr:hypothetical protein F5B20DRAFT_584163 [Whalleya microplaca]